MNEIEKLEQGIAAIEQQRKLLGEAVAQAALELLRQRLAELKSEQANAGPVEGAAQPKGEAQSASLRCKPAAELFSSHPGAASLAEGLEAGALLALINQAGRARLEAGEYAAAEELLRQAPAPPDGGSPETLAETYRLLSEACLAQEKLSQAVDAARRAIALAQGSGSQELAAAWRAMGNCSVRAMFRRNTGPLAADRPATVPHPRLCFSESLHIARMAGRQPDQAYALRDWALYERRIGNLIEAAPLWDEARQIFLRLELQAEVERMDQAN